MFKHFLITRFNLRKSDWNTNKNNQSVLTDEWHRNRFKLFTDYCVPTIVSQTNQDFEWLVFFDTSTKTEFRTIVDTLQAEIPNFKPFYVDGVAAFNPTLTNYIAKSDTDYIITSGLDNDDSLHKDYINEVQSYFNQQDFLYLDFVDGYTLQIRPEARVGKKLHPFNPFASLIEKNDNAQSIYFREHHHWKREKRVLQIRHKRIWSSVIHSENMVNEFTGYDAVDISKFFESFAIDKTIQTDIKQRIEPQSTWKTQSFKNKLSSNWIFFTKRLKKQLGFYK